MICQNCGHHEASMQLKDMHGYTLNVCSHCATMLKGAEIQNVTRGWK